MKYPASGSIQMPDEQSPSDAEIEDIVGHLWENIDALPLHIQELLHDTHKPGNLGVVSYTMLAGWALGKFEYVLGDPWKGTKAGWQPKEKDVN